MAEFDTEATFKDKEWKKVREALGKKLKSLNTVKKSKEKKTLSAIISIPVFKDIIRHFEKEAGPKGKWKSWSTSYSDHMKKIGKGGNKILQDSGRLRQSFLKTKSNKNVSGSRSVKKGILYFNNAKTAGGFAYAAAHNKGGKRLPQRKFMWLSTKALRNISKVTLAWINEDPK